MLLVNMEPNKAYIAINDFSCTILQTKAMIYVMSSLIQWETLMEIVAQMEQISFPAKAGHYFAHTDGEYVFIWLLIYCFPFDTVM